MPFMSKITKEVVLPDGNSVTLRAPSFMIKLAASAEHPNDPVGVMVALTRACIAAWSFPEPVSPELADDLDDESWSALLQAMKDFTPEPDAGPLDSPNSMPPSKEKASRHRS